MCPATISISTTSEMGTNNGTGNCKVHQNHQEGMSSEHFNELIKFNSNDSVKPQCDNQLRQVSVCRSNEGPRHVHL